MARHTVVVDVHPAQLDGTEERMTIEPDGLQHLPFDKRVKLVTMFAAALELPPIPTPHPGPLCRRCHKPFATHGIFHNPPPEPVTLPEADFGFPTSGLYCI